MKKFMMLAALGLLGVASAERSNVNLSVPLTLTVPNPCVASETVTLSGNVHVVGQIDTDTSGTTAKLHVNLQNFGGSAASGRLYRAQLNGKANLDFAPMVLPASASGTVNVRLISQGPADNFQLRLNFDLAVDAGGNVTVSNPTAVPEGRCNG
ncbi:hypothetical protein Dcar01_02846 [Deinococcus carri]|uniref:Uncharacterized protein n=1 Tax=Deinococcus carri TaxID=1211323 RepID=A0ABP9W9R8_9DEIO